MEPIIEVSSFKAITLNEDSVNQWKNGYYGLRHIRTDDDHKGILLIDMAKKQVVGFVNVNIPKKEIQGIEVNPEYRRMGIATMLLDKAKKLGATGLWVRDNNMKARALYTKTGWKEISKHNQMIYMTTESTNESCDMNMDTVTEASKPKDYKIKGQLLFKKLDTATIKRHSSSCPALKNAKTGPGIKSLVIIKLGGFGRTYREYVGEIAGYVTCDSKGEVLSRWVSSKAKNFGIDAKLDAFVKKPVIENWSCFVTRETPVNEGLFDKAVNAYAKGIQAFTTKNAGPDKDEKKACDYPDGEASFRRAKIDYKKNLSGKYTKLTDYTELIYFKYPENLCKNIAKKYAKPSSEFFIHTSNPFGNKHLGEFMVGGDDGFVYCPELNKWFQYNVEKKVPIDIKKPVSFSYIQSFAKKDINEGFIPKPNSFVTEGESVQSSSNNLNDYAEKLKTDGLIIGYDIYGNKLIMHSASGKFSELEDRVKASINSLGEYSYSVIRNRGKQPPGYPKITIYPKEAATESFVTEAKSPKKEPSVYYSKSEKDEIFKEFQRTFNSSKYKAELLLDNMGQIGGRIPSPAIAIIHTRPGFDGDKSNISEICKEATKRSKKYVFKRQAIGSPAFAHFIRYDLPLAIPYPNLAYGIVAYPKSVEKKYRTAAYECFVTEGDLPSVEPIDETSVSLTRPVATMKMHKKPVNRHITNSKGNHIKKIVSQENYTDWF